MSLNDRTMKVTYTGNGATTTFALPDVPIVDDSAEVVVYTRDESAYPAVVSLRSEGALNDYTLTGAPDNDSFHTNVEFNTAPVSGLKVVVALRLPLTQTLDYNGNNSAGIRPTQIELALDRAFGLIQQLSEELSRVPKMGITEQSSVADLSLPDPETGVIRVFAWDAAGALTSYTLGELDVYASGTPNLDDLVDVNAGSPSDGEVLTWDNGTSRWVNAVGSASAGYSVESIAAAAQITNVTDKDVQYRPVVGNGGAVSASTTPFGTGAGWGNGDQIVLRGTNDTNTVQITHNDAAGGAILNGNAILGANDILTLIYDSADNRWIEVSRNF